MTIIASQQIKLESIVQTVLTRASAFIYANAGGLILTIKATLWGTVVVAFVQGALGGLGFLIFGLFRRELSKNSCLPLSAANRILRYRPYNIETLANGIGDLIDLGGPSQDMPVFDSEPISRRRDRAVLTHEAAGIKKAARMPPPFS